MSWLRKLFGGSAPASKPPEQKASAVLSRSEPAWVFSFSNSARPDDLLKSSSWLYACADRTATALSSIPVVIKQGTTEIPWNSDHPLANLLREPIPDTTWTQWVEEVGLYAQLTGCAYLEKRRVKAYGPSLKHPGLGLPAQLWPSGANAWKAKVDDLVRRQVIESYEPRVGSDKTKLPPSEIVRIAYQRLGKRAEAMSKVEAAQGAINADRGAVEWQTSGLKNRGVPDGIIRVKGGYNTIQEQNLIAHMDAEWVGARNAHRPLILGDESEWIDLAKTMHDMEMIAGRKFTRSEICAVMGVPEVIFDIAGSTYANLETALYAHMTQTVLPLAARILDALNLSVCREFGPEYYLDADLAAVPALLPVLQRKWEIAKHPLDRGVPLDDVSDAFDLNVPRRPGTDIGYVPSNQVPIQSLAAGIDADLSPAANPLPSPMPAAKSAQRGVTA